VGGTRKYAEEINELMYNHLNQKLAFIQHFLHFLITWGVKKGQTLQPVKLVHDAMKHYRIVRFVLYRIHFVHHTYETVGFHNILNQPLLSNSLATRW